MRPQSKPFIEPMSWESTLLIRLMFINTIRSEEHTSELQSRPHLVCRLLLEKKKKKKKNKKKKKKKTKNKVINKPNNITILIPYTGKNNYYSQSSPIIIRFYYTVACVH